MDLAFRVVKMVSSGVRYLSVDEVQNLLGLNPYEARMWCLDLCGSARGIRAEDLMRWVILVPVDDARRAASGVRGAMQWIDDAKRRLRYHCKVYDYVPFFKLLRFVKDTTGDLSCLKKNDKRKSQQKTAG